MTYAERTTRETIAQNAFKFREFMTPGIEEKAGMLMKRMAADEGHIPMRPRTPKVVTFTKTQVEILAIIERLGGSCRATCLARIMGRPYDHVKSMLRNVIDKGGLEVRGNSINIAVYSLPGRFDPKLLSAAEVSNAVAVFGPDGTLYPTIAAAGRALGLTKYAAERLPRATAEQRADAVMAEAASSASSLPESLSAPLAGKNEGGEA